MGKVSKKGNSIQVTIPAEIARVKGWQKENLLTFAFLVTGPTTKVDKDTPVIIVETVETSKKGG